MQQPILRTLQLSLLFLLTFSAPFNPETYRVIYVRGKIMDISQDKYLRPKMDLSEKDSLYFEDNNSRAVLTSPRRGRFVLKPQAQDAQANDPHWKEAREVLWQALYPLNVQHRIVRRSAQPEISNLKEYMGDSVFCIIGNHLRVRLRESEYNLHDPKSYFALRYQVQGKDYYHRVPSQDQIIEFSTQTFTAENDEQVDPNGLGPVDLYFVEGNKPQIVSNFSFLYLEDKEVKESMDIIREIEADSIPQDSQLKYKYYQQAFFEIYGQTDFWYLERWLKNNTF